MKWSGVKVTFLGTKVLCTLGRPYTECTWLYRGADKSLARPGRKQARKHVRDARDFNNIETRDVIKFFSLEGKVPKEIHAILTETLVCFLPARAKDLSPPLYYDYFIRCVSCTAVVWTCFVICGWVYVWVFWRLCGCFDNMCTCICCVLYCLYCVLVLFRLCIFILICFVCTSLMTTATKWQLNCSK